MTVRLVLILVAAAATMSSAHAADLGGTPCDCGSNMITIYDIEPGVVTRHWKADCPCRYAPPARRPHRAAAQVVLPEGDSFIEPWRRW